MKDLKERAIRGGFAKICSQIVSIVLRVGSLMVLARLLDPKDFGLVGMVTAVVGVLSLFKEFGLSTAAVQRSEITHEQMSTLFWINIGVGVILGLVAVGMAPIVAAFYHQPELVWVAIALSLDFVFNGAGVQHAALLQRQMRFTTLSLIDVIVLVLSIAVGIAMAFLGFRYWALVGMALASPLASTVCMWIFTRWVPGKPHLHVGIRSLMRFGGAVTLNGLVAYLAYNFEKILLGRFWGADALGIYGRSYQMANIPTNALNSAAGGVAFSALSRIQDQPQRLKSYFLQGYALILGLTLPATIWCTLFANELVLVVLGPKWTEAAPIFRLLAPTILIFAMINPFAWLLLSIGMVGRSLKTALVICPIVIAGYVLGLRYGPKGVALGYSLAMAIWVIPHILWCVKDTPISFRDVLRAIHRPGVSALVAIALPLTIRVLYPQTFSPLTTLVLGGILFSIGYVGMLLYVMGQKAFYMNLVRGLIKRSATDSENLATA
jgi:O-antigen/teichoic acid export membrane protein